MPHWFLCYMHSFLVCLMHMSKSSCKLKKARKKTLTLIFCGCLAITTTQFFFRFPCRVFVSVCTVDHISAPAWRASQQLCHTLVLKLSLGTEALTSDALSAFSKSMVRVCGGGRNPRTFSVSLRGESWPQKLGGVDEGEWLTVGPCWSNSDWQSLVCVSMLH